MNVIVRLLGIVLLLIGDLLKPFFWWRMMRSHHKRVPTIDNDILLLSACELAERIRQRKLSAVQVIATYIERIRQVNPILNAVTDDRFDDALIDAQAIDDFLDKASVSQLFECKPFLGVPITIKESCGVGGLSQSVGAIGRRGIKCSADCPSVQRLKAAGFIPLVVTNTPELCMGIETINLLNGCTRNPYNTNYSVGGSSGGEAALLSAAASVVGIGSDYAGSIRLPCMFTGLFGHKPSPRTIDRSRHFPNVIDNGTLDYFAIGPMTRYACDLKPILRILCGDCLQLEKYVPLIGVTVFYTSDYFRLFGVQAVSQSIRKGLRTAVKYLRQECKMIARQAVFPEMENALEISSILLTHLDDRKHLKFLSDPNNPDKDLNLYVELVKSLFGQSAISIYLLLTEFILRRNAFIPRSHLPYYVRKMQVLQRNICDTLGVNGVLLFPTFPSSTCQHYQLITKACGTAYSTIFNAIGCPVTQVPIGFDDKGLPIGIQVIASPGQDRLSIAVAESLEKCFGGWRAPT